MHCVYIVCIYEHEFMHACTYVYAYLCIYICVCARVSASACDKVRKPTSKQEASFKTFCPVFIIELCMYYPF